MQKEVILCSLIDRHVMWLQQPMHVYSMHIYSNITVHTHRLYAAVQLTLPGVGVSSHLFLRGVGPSAGLPGVGVASHRLPAPGVAPGVASQWAAGVAPGVASQLLVAGVASTVSQSATFAFLLQQQRVLSGTGLPAHT